MPETLGSSMLAVIVLSAACGLFAIALPKATSRTSEDPATAIARVASRWARLLTDRAGSRLPAGLTSVRHGISEVLAVVTTALAGAVTWARTGIDSLVDSLRADSVPVFEGPMMMASGRGEPPRRRGLFRRRGRDADPDDDRDDSPPPEAGREGPAPDDGASPDDDGPDDDLDVPEPLAPAAEAGSGGEPATAAAAESAPASDPEPASAPETATIVQPRPARPRRPRRPSMNYIPLDESTSPASEAAGEEDSLKGRFRRGLRKTRDFLNRDVREVFGAGPVPEAFDSLEEILVRADIGVATAMALSEELRSRGRELTSDTIQAALRDGLRAQLKDADRRLRVNEDGVSVWLVVGVNGTGKTTSVAKLARHAETLGFSVCVAAADTYRAAAIEQLETWAERVGVDIVRQHPGADSAAVVFDAIQHAKARSHDLVIADTAGRLHTRAPLMDELRKVRRVIEREEGLLTETLLVLDATTGQNGIVQARSFQEAVGVTGLILTRLDSTAKGGIVVAVERELGIPVKAVGVGEKATDLAPFDPDAFVDAIFGAS